MRLNSQPFNLIKNWTKTVEMRLLDKKRSQLNGGDMISFTSRETWEILIKKVKYLHKYKSFRELIENVWVESVWRDHIDEIVEKMNIYYSNED